MAVLALIGPLRLAKTVRWALGLLVLIDAAITSLSTFRFGFTHDDLMNGYWGFTRGWGWLIADALRIWKVSPVFRPAGVAVVKAMHAAFGMNVFEWRVVYGLLFIGATILTFVLARRLSASFFAGAVTALLMSFHPGARMLYCNMGFLYDVLASLLTSAFVLGYLATRTGRGRVMLRSGLVLATFILALNAKEVAVDGALFVFFYELLNQPIRRMRDVAGWLKARPLMCAVIGLAVIFAIGRLVDPMSVANNADYRLSVSAGNYWTHLRRWVREIFVVALSAGLFGLVIIPALVCAFLRSRRLAAWCILCFLTGILPLAFIPFRDLEELFLPAMPLALLMALGLEGLLTLIVGRVRKFTTRVDALVAANVLAVVAALALVTAQGSPAARADDFRFDDATAEIMPALNALRLLEPRPQDRQFIVIESDPFGKNVWGSTFLFTLYFDRKDLNVWRRDRIPEGERRDTNLQWRHLKWENLRWKDVPVSSQAPL